MGQTPVDHVIEDAITVLEGDPARYDADDDAHRAAVILLVAHDLETESQPEIVEYTGYDRTFVEGVLARMFVAKLGPYLGKRHSWARRDGNPKAPLELCRDVQIVLGHAIRWIEDEKPRYRFTRKGREAVRLHMETRKEVMEDEWKALRCSR